MFEMTYIFGNVAINVFEKRPKYLGNDVDVGNGSNMWRNDLIFW